MEEKAARVKFRLPVRKTGSGTISRLPPLGFNQSAPILLVSVQPHDPSLPPLLSYDEPIGRVVEDKREQWVDMCQSLRLITEGT